MSDDKRFVNLSKSSGNWADEEDAGSAPEPKAAKSWGTVQQVKPVSLAEIQEDEAKNVQPKESHPRARGEYRGDRDRGHEPREHRDYPPRDREHDREPREHREPREPRQKNPVPEQPPYVAFLGNLAFSVTEDTVWEFFGELGVDQVRMVTDSQTGKPKGFAYVHFKDKDGLVNALTCDGMDFYGRRLNVDVAAPKAREERGQWGPRDGGSGRRGFDDRGFGDRGFGDRGDRGDRNYGPRGGDRAPPGERKPLNLAPRTKPLDADSAPAPSSSGEPKHTGTDPFGGATSDRAKMDQIAAERLKKEQERDLKRKEEIKQSEERRQREREERDRSRDDRKPGERGGRRTEEPRQVPPKSDKEAEIDSRSTWRSNRSANEESSRPRGSYNGRGGGGGGRGGGRAPEKKWVEDSDGFKTKKEESKPAPPGGSWAAVAAKTSSTDDSKSAANPFDALNGEQ